ncbi:MAG: efflux RND transporter periplasmic adaptor subunit [Polymorphobacter sp.]|uniref:efflux RND transporter periplasmic adaptor subunit n=1 Tax=Polymorphobacter sp. TaxID=1909290 RepID=UPI003A8BAE9B
MNMLNKLPKPDTAAVYEFDGSATVAGRGTSRAKFIRVAVVAGVVLAAVLAWQYFTARPAPAPATNLPPVTVMVPGTTTVVETVVTPGAIAARRDVAIGVQGEGGRITAVLVEAGQRVERGQILARIDRSVQTQQVARLEAEVRASEADAELAAANLERARALVDRGFISTADIDQRTATRDAARARVAVSRAQLAETRARLAMLDIRAPADGIILSRAVEVGQVVASGSTALFRLAEGSELEMRAQMAEQELARLQPGMPATVTPVGSSESFEGEIWLIDPVIDPNTRLGVARIRLPYDPRLRVGAFARASIKAGDAVRPMLPQSAVQTDAKGNYVFVVGPENVIARRDITVGETADKGVSIASGLTGAEQVVVSAGAFLRDGEKIDPVLDTAGN